MYYSARLINPLIQFGKLNFELLLQNLTDDVQFVRLFKKYNSGITRSEINLDVNQTISSILSELSLSQDDVEVQIDLPEGVEL